MQSKAKTKAQLMRETRKRRADAGLRLVQVYVHKSYTAADVRHACRNLQKPA